jgi:hypothetical protein
VSGFTLTGGFGALQNALLDSAAEPRVQLVTGDIEQLRPASRHYLTVSRGLGIACVFGMASAHCWHIVGTL